MSDNNKTPELGGDGKTQNGELSNEQKKALTAFVLGVMKTHGYPPKMVRDEGGVIRSTGLVKPKTPVEHPRIGVTQAEMDALRRELACGYNCAAAAVRLGWAKHRANKVRIAIRREAEKRAVGA